MTAVAFLGTGAMGLPMARNAAAAGLQLRAWNRTIQRAQPLREAGVEVVADVAQAASGAELLVTMLSDAEAVLSVAPQALDALAEGAVWAQLSTIGLRGTERCAELAAQRGVELVDAPVLGTVKPAEEGQLVVLASGPDGARDRCQALFDAIGSRTLWLGRAGGGTRLKLVVNNWLVGVVTVLGETIALAQALELDPARFFEAIDGGGLDLPYARLKGRAMVERSFEPSFRLALARKDGGLVQEAARDRGAQLRVLDAVLESFAAAEADGHGDEDMAAVHLSSRRLEGGQQG